MPNTPPSAFTIGQRVRVAPGAGKGPDRLGTVRDVVWHVQYERYDYYLEAGGRRITRSYSEGDLESAE